MKALTRNRADARERREQYNALRRSGLGVHDAAARTGVHEDATIYRYERWYQASVRGEQIIPARPGAQRGRP